jgi:hypothetical protein
MRWIILTVLATSLIAASAAQTATAAERHALKTLHHNFRGVYNQLNTPYAAPETGYGVSTGSNWRDDAKVEPAGN